MNRLFDLPDTSRGDETDLGSVDSAEPSKHIAIAEKEYSKDSQDADFDAFQRMLPELLKEHRGKYALIIEGKLVRIDSDEFALLKYAYSSFPDSDGLIQPIQEEPPLIDVGGSKYLIE